MATATAPAPSKAKGVKVNKNLAPTPITYPKEAITPSWVGRVPQLKPGVYADGMPIHAAEQVSFAPELLRLRQSVQGACQKAWREVQCRWVRCAARQDSRGNLR